MFERQHHDAPRTQAERAHRQIRKAILNGKLRPGQKLVQSQLADELDISITPVREALNRLTEEGLVASTPHRGIAVAEMDMNAVEDIYKMRKLIEPLQIQASIEKLTPESISHARKLMEQMDATRDVVEFTDLNGEFHAAIMGLDSSWTSRVVSILFRASAPYVSMALSHYPEVMPELYEFHHTILHAAAEGQVEHFVNLAVAHLDETLDMLRDAHAAVAHTEINTNITLPRTSPLPS